MFPAPRKRFLNPAFAQSLHELPYNPPGRQHIPTRSVVTMHPGWMQLRSETSDRQTRLHDLLETLGTPLVIDEGAVLLNPAAGRQNNLGASKQSRRPPIRGAYHAEPCQQLIGKVGLE